MSADLFLAASLIPHGVYQQLLLEPLCSLTTGFPLSILMQSHRTKRLGYIFITTTLKNTEDNLSISQSRYAPQKQIYFTNSRFRDFMKKLHLNDLDGITGGRPSLPALTSSFLFGASAMYIYQHREDPEKIYLPWYEMRGPARKTIQIGGTKIKLYDLN